MSGTAYWEERERAKADALKMAAQLSAREKGTVVLGVNRGMCDDARHDQTQQRTFERSFLSLDAPDEDGNMWDYGDCGRAMRRMFRDLDAPFWPRWMRSKRTPNLRGRSARSAATGTAAASASPPFWASPWRPTPSASPASAKSSPPCSRKSRAKHHSRSL